LSSCTFLLFDVSPSFFANRVARKSVLDFEGDLADPAKRGGACLRFHFSRPFQLRSTRHSQGLGWRTRANFHSHESQSLLKKTVINPVFPNPAG
jgi:hypothetical protein